METKDQKHKHEKCFEKIKVNQELKINSEVYEVVSIQPLNNSHSIPLASFSNRNTIK